MAVYAPYFDGPQPTADEVSAQMTYESAVQDAIAACMSKRGFRYLPMTFRTEDLFPTGMGDSLRYLSVPFLDQDRTVVERNGYGVMGTPDQEAYVDPRNPDTGPSRSGDDPNAAYVQSLSPAEADAYSRALNGDYTVPTTDGSCFQEAMDANPTPTSWYNRLAAWNVENQDVLQAAMEMLQGFSADSRVVAVNREWGGCMNGKGYGFDDASVLDGPMAALHRAIRTRPDGTVGPERLDVPSSQIPVEESSLLGTAAERAVALDDSDCRTSTHYLARLISIRVQMDNDFIAANRTALERLKNSQ